jgi:hypothetical protein
MTCEVMAFGHAGRQTLPTPTSETDMNLVRPAPLLKTALLADAGVSAAAALLQLAAAAPLAGLLKLPQPLLFESGLFLVAYVALLLVMARSARLAVPLVMLVVVGNVGWALACLALATLAAPAALGVAYLVLQALAVLAFAALEYRGLAASTPVHRAVPAAAR